MKKTEISVHEIINPKISETKQGGKFPISDIHFGLKNFNLQESKPKSMSQSNVGLRSVLSLVQRFTRMLLCR
jgi:hypothetical protein